MSFRQKISPVETLLPVEISKGKILYAQGVRAGRWVFATGHMATDFKNGLAPGVLNPRLPRSSRPKQEREAEVIFEHLKAVLKAAGSDLPNAVRLDQYYPTWKAVDPYHVVRRATFGEYIPPSTSVLQKSLLLSGAEIEVQMMAIIPDGEFQVQKAPLTDEWTAPPTSAFMPVVLAGDYVFLAGALATSKDLGSGIAPEAKVPYGQLWGGTQIKLQTDYIIRRKFEPVLQVNGSSLANVIKAQVYMSDVDDFPSFTEVWGKYFPNDPPVTTLIPTYGFGRPEGKIEINLIALADKGKTKKEVVNADVFTGYENQSVAIRAGDLLFISGLMAIDRNGLIPEAEVDPRQPYFGFSIKAQMDYILQNAEKICHAAGTSLENIVRIQQFHTNLGEFYPAYEVWQKYLPGRFLPFSAVQVPEPMPVPGCSVLLDLWIYVP